MSQSLEERHGLAGADDDDGLVRAQGKKLLVARAEHGGLTAQSGGQHEVVFRMRRHAMDREGQFRQDGFGPQQGDNRLRVSCGQATSKIGICHRPSQLTHEVI